MKFILIMCLLMLSTELIASDLDKPYTPTRGEWLRMSIDKQIKDCTGGWKLHIWSYVIIKDKTITVALNEVNGETPPSKQVKDGYVKYVTRSIEYLLKRYPWVSTYKLSVLFL